MSPLSDAKSSKKRPIQTVVFAKNMKVQDLTTNIMFTAVTSPTLMSPEGACTNE